MSIKTAYSKSTDISIIAGEIKKQIGDIKGKFVVFFASSNYDLEAIGKKLQGEYPGAKIIGCTTAGEIISGHMLKDSVVVQVMDGDTISDAAVTVIPEIKDKNKTSEALKDLEKQYYLRLEQMDIEKYVGIVLFDGLSGAEEKIMDSLGNLSDLVFIGGSAGDDLKFQQTYVYANGKSYSNAAVLALIKPAKGFEIIKTQSFVELDKKLNADEVDEASRTVIKFNGTGAVEAYAKATGVSAEKASEKFMVNPLGLMAGGEPYVRSPQQAKDGKMVFYCNIKQGMELSVLESTDIVSDTASAVARVKGAAGILNFNCILRTLELEAKNKTAEYGKIFENIPTVGFSTYGEAYLGHINQTATMLVLK